MLTVIHSFQVAKEWSSVSASSNHSRMKEICQVKSEQKEGESPSPTKGYATNL